jgi:hypothetical protein
VRRSSVQEVGVREIASTQYLVLSTEYWVLGTEY